MKFAKWKTEKKDNASANIDAIVNRYFFKHAPKLPLVYHSRLPSYDLNRWYEHNRSVVESELKQYGAIVFRGFQIKDQQDFSRFTEVAITQRAAYVEGATPRTHLDGGIYTATEFPSDQEIALHNELSYVTSPPSRLAFSCLQPPQTGGQTQICDVQAVLRALDPKVVEAFEQKGGWLLRRNYLEGFGPTIFKAFGKSTLEDIANYCKSVDVSMKVLSPKHVVTEQVRPAVHQHPQSGHDVWFNHIAFWHPSSLCPKVREEMDKAFSNAGYPYATYYADGSEIPEEHIQHIRQVYLDNEVTFDWKKGDVMLLDNWQVSHGRKPFTGSRQVLVAMG
ncbi:MULTISPECIES: TauD/TfdA family dioxygenase [unclassified Pseudoalteromonas]|uniref:TauD/TfdA family dioxygenase n=1 Tax=unclassified Pseudoalteromonas TaxID=194690 RepID=UPI000411AC05|nr:MULTISPECIES: TauD/TfdA family dioxygenase [unclassified Pseudoalteromonas]PCC14224.1 TauD/TfdA family dioxygenase [Pseudoalteromonas sp. JB197]SJN16290.1 SyrP-like protein [Pseudoalteromonas sp. JB197]